MVASTKKAGPAGRLGARYGSLARKSVAAIERVQRAKHLCAQCGTTAVRRLHTGIWECRKCGDQFAGGAYVPTTGAGGGSEKTLRGITDKLVRGQEAAAEDAAIEEAFAEEQVEATADEGADEAASTDEATDEDEA